MGIYVKHISAPIATGLCLTTGVLAVQWAAGVAGSYQFQWGGQPSTAQLQTIPVHQTLSLLEHDTVLTWILKSILYPTKETRLTMDFENMNMEDFNISSFLDTFLETEVRRKLLYFFWSLFWIVFRLDNLKWPPPPPLASNREFGVGSRTLNDENRCLLTPTPEHGEIAADQFGNQPLSSSITSTMMPLDGYLTNDIFTGKDILGQALITLEGILWL